MITPKSVLTRILAPLISIVIVYYSITSLLVTLVGCNLSTSSHRTCAGCRAIKGVVTASGGIKGYSGRGTETEKETGVGTARGRQGRATEGERRGVRSKGLKVFGSCLLFH